MTTTFKQIGILGAGQMGAGIAQVAAASGFAVALVDRNDANCERGLKAIRTSLDRLVKRETISADVRESTLGHITVGTNLEAFASCDLVVEAVSENLELKLDCFRKLDAICKPGAILATNTSSISITHIAGATRRPGDVIGMHFMNPVPIMKLVEVIRGLMTSDETLAATLEISRQLGKTTVVAADYPGFIVNRILMPMINEACVALMEGVGTVEDIDTAMKLGTNQPMGPLTLADFIGLDTCLAIMEVLYNGLGDSKYRPCPLLRNYVLAGRLGRKSGHGFYSYSA